MKFPKPVMSINELTEMGFSRDALNNMYLKFGFPLAFKETGTRTCPIKFDTELLNKQIGKINERRH